jgi:hypothetical protein
VIAGISFAGTYNKLVTLGVDVDKSWAEVENQYQRRADLVPNLVATVQGAATFEKETLTAVTEARASVGRATITPGKAPTDPESLAKYQAAQDQLGSALQRLLVGFGALSGAQGEPELPRPAGPARGHGEPDHGRPRPVQRFGPVVQHRSEAVPDQPDRRHARIQGEALLQGHDAGRRRSAEGAVQLQRHDADGGAGALSRTADAGRQTAVSSKQ